MTSQKSRPWIGIRADASPSLGVGHVMRCLALAQAIKDLGATPALLSRHCPENVSVRCRAEGVTVDPLDLPQESRTGGSEDAQATASWALEHQAQALIVDSYAYDPASWDVLRSAGLAVLVLDDDRRCDHYPVRWLLNPNAGSEAFREEYSQRAPGSELWLGSRYAPLRREFRDARRLMSAQTASASASSPLQKGLRVLVSMGGSDPFGMTLPAVRNLVGFSRAFPGRISELAIVLGPAYPDAHAAERVIQACRTDADDDLVITVHREVADMVPLMVQSDLAVIAGGSTLWECAALGLPTLAIVVADNQILGVEAAVNAGFARPFTLEALANEVQLLTDEPERLAAMSAAGRSLIDTRGALRVASGLLDEPVFLRDATADDAALLFAWANDPLTRAMSFQTEPIGWDEHVAWLNNQLASRDTLFWIGLDDRDQPIGQVRLQRDADHAARALIGVSVAPERRGQGWALRLIATATLRGARIQGLQRVTAQIKTENYASLRAFARAGYAPLTVSAPTAEDGLQFVTLYWYADIPLSL